MSKKPADQLLNVSQAAKRLSVSAVTLRRWEKQGKLIPQRTAGNQRRYSLSQIKNFKSKPTTSPPPTPTPSQKDSFHLPNLLPTEPLTHYSFSAKQKSLIALALSLLVTTSAVFTSNKTGLTNQLFPITKFNSFLSPTSSLVKPKSSTGTVLAAQTSIPNDLTFKVNIPAKFTDTVTVEELITDNVKINAQVIAPNVLYSLTASTTSGLSITGTQNLTITNTDKG